MTITIESAARTTHERWLLELTQLPTAAGREWRVIQWIRRWVEARPLLRLREDRAGNLIVEPRELPLSPTGSPIFFTAHLDHPAFVVHRVIGPSVVELAFRGGVNDVYFPDARLLLHIGANGPDDDRPVLALPAQILSEGDGIASPPPETARAFKTYIAQIDPIAELPGLSESGAQMRVGDVATWHLLPAEIDAHGLVHTHACDDLAAAAAALAAYDTFIAHAHEIGTPTQDVRLLFTRSEEIGFTGAIAACRLGTMPRNARVIALENSRSFSDSPIGGGPIVRVGDRLSVFDPRLTAACAKRAEDISGHAATPTARESAIPNPTCPRPSWKWQRKLMAGGACEATVFCAAGYSATCLCLPLGNYHNMAHLDAVQNNTYDAARLGPPRAAREFIALSDFHALVDLLLAIAIHLPEADPASALIERLYTRHVSVLDELTPPGARA